MDYIKAMRLPASILIGIFTLLGFRITSGTLASAYLPAVATFLIITATMAHNDLRDRFNDTRKGKSFAFDHPTEFKLFVIALWILAVTISLGLVYLNPLYLILSGLMVTSGLIYSETRLLPFIPNTLVALTVASAMLYPVFDSHQTNPILWLFFTIIFLTIYAREILKDFDDKEIDLGYKWTLLEKYGQERAKAIAIILLIGSSLLLDIATIPLFCLPGWILVAPIISLSINDLSPKSIGRTKLILDICLLFIVFFFIFK